MVHTTNVAAAASALATTSAAPARPLRFPSSGSFHAGEPFPQLSPYDEAHPNSRARRRSSAAGSRPHGRQATHKYHTFPTPPPKTPSEQRPPQRADAFFFRPVPSSSGGGDRDDGDDDGSGSDTWSLTAPDVTRRQTGGGSDTMSTPLPWKQLGLLALLSLAEQTALNSIGPYLPTMVASFDEIPHGEEGLYVGMLASAFALAQLTTNLLWGYTSDRVGRKPVMLLGTALLMVCFAFFGFCSNYKQLLLVHIAMGLLNGNAAVVPTCLGEVTDRTNQSSAFTWLPVMYSLGSITGPALGGLLVGIVKGSEYPFLPPNLLAAALLFVSVAVLGVWFEETLDQADQKAAGAGLGWVEKMCRPCSSCFSSRRNSNRVGGWKSPWRTHFQRGVDSAAGEHGESDEEISYTSQENGSDEGQALLTPSASVSVIDDDDADSKSLTAEQKSAFRQLANRTTLTVLVTYLVFQLSNISFNSLYPIFVSAPPPTGRDLGPRTIGLSLSLAGLATVLFQVFAFQPLKARMGNLGAYRYSLLGIAVSMAFMPWIGYLEEKNTWWGLGTGKEWLYTELGFVLVVKNICAVGGLSSVMLLITNSAPSHETLGTLNGIAQSLSAAGRSIGPFLSGGLFTLSIHVQPKGEALAWGSFAGIALIGWMGTLLIRGGGLESADWMGNDEDSDGDGTGDEEEGQLEAER
ncbi:major facilitator superfamily domain-containing protein [Lasiosphaeria ovina]|uniref:Major facilitator superfamily domain-containing protein n=1 Tax=Lasiosphaeria ovina TaxID=92902 RepID=A0AAE0K0G6_9PEZI|nr:major facilitator superfamily domain-containing protein [Lasiosphaeria ovina]